MHALKVPLSIFSWSLQGLEGSGLPLLSLDGDRERQEEPDYT